MKDITSKDSQTILKVMCKAVGVDYKNFNFNDKEWYCKYSWTVEEEDIFRIWLGKFLVDHKYAMKGTYRGQNAGYYEAGKILMNYGWKLKIQGI
jgi:hypothetical protein